MYTGSSLILSQGQATAGQIDAFMAAQGKALAPRYAPDKTYKAPPATLGDDIIHLCSKHGYGNYIINHDLVAAQIAKETAGWQSDFARNRNNPAGLGAINDNPGQAIYFVDVLDGLAAMVAHLLVYVVGNGKWAQDDPRYEAVAGRGWVGTCKTIADLNGKWAFPGTTYGQDIASLANRLLETQAPMTAQIPGFQWVPETCGEYGYPQGTHGRNGVTIDRLIIHCTIGTDSLGHLTGGNGNSVHLLDNRDGTPRAQMVALEDAAWGAGNKAYNLRGVNYEHECTNAEMLNPAYWTDSIIGNMAKNCAAILRLCPNILPDREHVIGHGDVPDQDHYDPGPVFPWDRFMAALVGELNGAGDTSIRYFPETGFHVGHGFLAFWSQFGSDATSVAVFGYPLTEEIQEDGRTVQYFERAVFEYWPENPPEYTVLLRRLGADALEAA